MEDVAAHSDGYGRLDRALRLVAGDGEVLEAVVENRRRMPRDGKPRIARGFPRCEAQTATGALSVPRGL